MVVEGVISYSRGCRMFGDNKECGNFVFERTGV